MIEKYGPGHAEMGEAGKNRTDRKKESETLAEALTLEQLLEYVERAVNGDRMLLVQLYRTFQQLAHHPAAPPEERLLGEILSSILMGERCPNLDRLPPDMAAEVRLLLDQLKHRPKPS